MPLRTVTHAKASEQVVKLSRTLPAHSMSNIQTSDYSVFMEPMSLLMTRVGQATVELARSVSALEPGDQVRTFQDLADEFGCGKGTIQAAVGVLEQAGALSLVSRGHLGSFINAMDRRVLWEIAGNRTVAIAMPLPYSLRYEGLATGFHESFEAAGIPLSLPYVRGADERMRLLRERRVDLVLMSAMAAESQPDMVVVHDYGPSTYVGAHSIISLPGTDLKDTSIRVGVDPSSPDQRALVARAFPRVPPDSYVSISYNQLSQGFASRRIEATVWNDDEVRVHLPMQLEVTALTPPDDRKNTHAVVARWDREDDPESPVLEALRSPTVLETATAVLDGQMIPTY